MLTKFPVKTDRGEYRVTIRRSLIFEHAYVTKVFVVRTTKVPFLKFRKVRDSLSATKEWRDDLIGLAKTAVLNAEKDEDERILRSTVNPQAIEAFRNWDGDLTTKGESR